MFALHELPGEKQRLRDANILKKAFSKFMNYMIFRTMVGQEDVLVC